MEADVEDRPKIDPETPQVPILENGCLSSASRAPFLTILAPPGLSQNVRFEFHGELLGTNRPPEGEKSYS